MLVGGQVFHLDAVGELEHVGRFEEVDKLSAVAVHECRNRDGRHLRLVLVGKLLADGETLAVSIGHHSKLRARGNHALEIQPVDESMALRRFDAREVRWHRSCLFHAVGVWFFFHIDKIDKLFILFSCLQRSLPKSVGEHLAMKSVKGEPRCQPLALIKC